MSTQRRNADRETTESVDRLWQAYADEIGLPKSDPAAADEPLPRRSADVSTERRPVRPVVRSASRILGPTAAVLMAAIGGIALWPQSSAPPGRAARPPQTLASAPTGETSRIASPAAPGKLAGDEAPTVVPAATTATDIVAPSTTARPEPVVRPESIVRPDPVPTRAMPPTVMYRISFDFGSDSLTAEAKRALDEIAGAMSANSGWRMAIEGHADSHGTPDYNRALSERRAHAVKAHLQSAGIAPARLSAAGFGASRPVAPNDPGGNFRNRRVELRRQ